MCAVPYQVFAGCAPLSRGDSGEDVKSLQAFLYAQYEGFPSPTGYFGPVTESGVRQWQKEHGVVSSGSPQTTGYGMVGPKTRAAMGLVCRQNDTKVTEDSTGSSVAALIKSLLAQVAVLQDRLAALRAAASASSTAASPLSPAFSGAAASGTTSAPSSPSGGAAPAPVSAAPQSSVATSDRVDPADYGALDDGVTDSTRAFRAALAALQARGGGTLAITKRTSGRYLFALQAGGTSPALTVPSHTTVSIGEGVTLLSQTIFGGFNSGLLVANSGSNIRIEGPGMIKAAPGVSFRGGITKGSTVITDIADTSGIRFHMPVDGPGIPHGTSVAEVGAHTVTLTATALTTAEGSFIARYTGAPYISITGASDVSVDGVQVGDYYGAFVGFTNAIDMSAQGFTISNITCRFDDRPLAAVLGADGHSSDWAFGGQACIVIHSPSSSGTVTNISGVSGDDLVALNVENEDPDRWDGDIHGINVSNVSGQSLWAQAIRLYVNPLARVGQIYDIRIDGVTAKADALAVDGAGNRESMGISIQDLSGRKAIHDVTISRATIDASRAGHYGVWVQHARNVRMSDIAIDGANYASFYVEDSPGFALDGFRITNQRSRYFPAVWVGQGSTGAIISRGSFVSGNYTQAIEIRSDGATVADNTISHAGGYGIYVNSNGNTVRNNVIRGTGATAIYDETGGGQNTITGNTVE